MYLSYRSSFTLCHLRIYEFIYRRVRKYFFECVIGGCECFNNHNKKKKKLIEGVKTRNSATKTNNIILRKHPCNYCHPCC